MKDIYRGNDLNTAERAMNLLAHEPDTRVEGESGHCQVVCTT